MSESSGTMVERQIAQRDRIVDYLNEHGAATLDDISGAVDLDREVVRNLTRQLQAERLVTRSGVDGGSIRYAAAAAPHPAIADPPDTADDGSQDTTADDGGDVVEQRDSDVLDLIRANPAGVKTSDVADTLDVTSDVAYAAIRRLVDDGLAVKSEQTDGRAAIWQPADTSE